MSVSVQFGDRTYPVRSRQSRPSTLPAVLTTIGDRTWKTMPMSRVLPQSADGVVIDAYVRSVQLLRQRTTDVNNLFRAVFGANVEARTDDANRHLADDLKRSKLIQLLSDTPSLEPPTTNVLDWHLAARPGEEIHAALQEDTLKLLGRFLHQTADALDELTARKAVGLIDIKPEKPSVLRYTYHRWYVTQITTSDRSKSTESTGDWVKQQTNAPDGSWVEEQEVKITSTTDRDLRRTETNGEYVHELYDAKLSPWDVDIKKPAYVEWFLSVIPEWLKPHVRIAHGKMLKESIIELDTTVKEWTEYEEQSVVEKRTRSGNLWSPAVCVGHWCLTGWSDRDI